MPPDVLHCRRVDTKVKKHGFFVDGVDSLMIQRFMIPLPEEEGRRKIVFC